MRNNLAVYPDFQNQRMGSDLVNNALSKANVLGEALVPLRGSKK
ncbi:MAG: hypothetical protein AAF757_12405 [Cyanobacteria bacterium P01_D01_bin.116]